MELANLASYFTNRRSQLQDWDSNPPHLLGFLILLLVSFEMALMRVLVQKSGLGLMLIAKTISFVAFFLILEIIVSKIGHKLATYTNKRGNQITCLTFFNVSLLPLLIGLPIGLICWMAGGLSGVGHLLLILLFLQVLMNWRESMEIAYELSRLQSALVLYISVGLTVIGIFFLVYVSLIKTLTAFI